LLLIYDFQNLRFFHVMTPSQFTAGCVSELTLVTKGIACDNFVQALKVLVHEKKRRILMKVGNHLRGVP